MARKTVSKRVKADGPVKAVTDPELEEEALDPWQPSKADASTLYAELKGRRCRIFVSAAYTKDPVHFVYSNGQYLGCEIKLKDAKRLANRGKRKPDADMPGANVQDYDISNDALGIPPEVQLSDAERKAAWLEHHTRGQSTRARLEQTRRLALPAPTPEQGGRRENRRARGVAVAEPMGRIHRLRQGNPKSQGSPAWQRWEKLFSYDGRSVSDYKSDKNNMTTLRNAIAKRWVEVKE